MVTHLTEKTQNISPDHMPVTHDDWMIRRWILALLGAISGIALYFLLDDGSSSFTENTARLAGATFVGVSAVSFAFVLEREKAKGSALFAILCGAIVASVLYWAGDIKSWEPWRLLSAALTVVIAAPLFQGWRDGRDNESPPSPAQNLPADTAGRTIFGRWYFPYRATHDRAWTNICLWCASWLFVGITIALAWLLATLFNLIGINELERALGERYVMMPLIGSAFGGAVGLLRDRERTLALLQRVSMMVLSVLAPVLAVGLVLFLIALPFTGLHTLWDTTKATTPILLCCVIGALILGNAIIGDSAEDEARMPVLRYSAVALAVVMLPLAAIAAYSTSLRIGQYGYTPPRLWAITFTLIACIYGAAYFYSVIRGKGTGWAQYVRPLNLRLAIGLCGLAFLLSTPVISFGSIAARDQVGRLLSGKVKPAQFDWVAMRFDYGPAGTEALKRLMRSDAPADIRKTAEEFLKRESRYSANEEQQKQAVADSLVVMPKGAKLPAALQERLKDWDACRSQDPCNVIYDAAKKEAIVFRLYGITVLRWQNDKWEKIEERPEARRIENTDKVNAAFRNATPEIRDVTRRQLYIDGQPVGPVFE